jgi:hypothetical protein
MSRGIRGALVTVVAGAALMLAACGSTSSSGSVGPSGTPGTSPATSASAAPSVSAAPSASASLTLNQALVDFTAAGGSSITGGGILTDLGDGTTAVTIGVVAAGITDPMPASIVPGTCASPGAAASPAASANASAAAGTSLAPGSVVKLGDLSAGASNTVVNMTLDDLLATPHAIAIYKAAGDDTIVSCADVTR